MTPQPNDTVRVKLRATSPFYNLDAPPYWTYQDYGVNPDTEYLVRFVDADFVIINQAPINGSVLMERRPCYGLSALCTEDYEIEVVR